MFKTLSATALLALASASFAQTQPGQTRPSITPSETPAVTPSQTPSVTPSYGAPIVGGPAPTIGGIEARSVGGLSQCENMLAFEREKCLQDERAGGAATGGTAAGAGTTAPQTAAPGMPQTATPAPQPNAPAVPQTQPAAPILATPSGLQRPDPAAERDLQRCEALPAEAKERCMKDVRAAITAGEKPRGPEATGAGSGASGAATGTAPGGAAPR
jgi:hypothetical protein